MPKMVEMQPEELLRQSLVSLNELIEKNPLSAIALCRRAKTNYQLNDNENALVDINQAMFLEPNNPSYSFLKSIILFNSGRIEEAILASEDAVAAELEDPLLYTHLANLYLEIDSLKRAKIYIN